MLKEFQSQQTCKEINVSSPSVGRETVTPLSRSTEYRGNIETEAVISQQSLFPEENFVLPRSRDRDAELLETGYGAVTAHSPSLNHHSPHSLCTDRVSRSNRNIMTSLERPPVSGSFEWDERSGQPGGQKFVDGMGSLTSDINGSGYLGIVLLSYIWCILNVYADKN